MAATHMRELSFEHEGQTGTVHRDPHAEPVITIRMDSQPGLLTVDSKRNARYNDVPAARLEGADLWTARDLAGSARDALEKATQQVRE